MLSGRGGMGGMREGHRGKDEVQRSNEIVSKCSTLSGQNSTFLVHNGLHLEIAHKFVTN